MTSSIENSWNELESTSREDKEEMGAKISCTPHVEGLTLYIMGDNDVYWEKNQYGTVVDRTSD